MAKGRGQLVLSRKVGEKIYIGDDITIEVVSVNNGCRGNNASCSIGVEAPREKLILRSELSRDAGKTPATAQDPEQDAPGAQGEQP